MINSMTVVLCNKLCAFGIFPKSQEKIYIYGFELMLSDYNAYLDSFLC